MMSTAPVCAHYGSSYLSYTLHPYNDQEHSGSRVLDVVVLFVPGCCPVVNYVLMNKVWVIIGAVKRRVYHHTNIKNVINLVRVGSILWRHRLTVQYEQTIYTPRFPDAHCPHMV